MEEMKDLKEFIVLGILVSLIVALWIVALFAYGTNRDAQLETDIVHATPLSAKITDKHVEANILSKDYNVTVPDGDIVVSKDTWDDLGIGQNISYKQVEQKLYLE